MKCYKCMDKDCNRGCIFIVEECLITNSVNCIKDGKSISKIKEFNHFNFSGGYIETYKKDFE